MAQCWPALRPGEQDSHLSPIGPKGHNRINDGLRVLAAISNGTEGVLVQLNPWFDVSSAVTSFYLVQYNFPGISFP